MMKITFALDAIVDPFDEFLWTIENNAIPIAVGTAVLVAVAVVLIILFVKKRKTK